MKPIMKNVTIDNHNEELVAFAQTIDFTALFDHIKTFTGVNCSFYQPEITTKRGEVYISVMSDDIAAQTGAFASILGNCCLASVGNKVVREKETNEMLYWVIISLRYEHKDGGSNGMTVLHASYRQNGEWTVLDTGAKEVVVV